jgi:hypothetical protein
METAIKEEKVMNVEKKSKKKKSGWEAFVNFLACGGFMLILVGIVGMLILASVVFKIKF